MYLFIDSFGFLIISALGLAIIFGMMGIINLAHGEYIMLGAYITTLTAAAGMPFIIALLCGSLGVGLFGGIVDRLIIRHLYKRPLDSVVASWGVSLIMSQGMLVLMGPSIPGLSTPMGSINVGQFDYSVYRIFLGFLAIFIMIVLYVLFKKTKFGLHSRATMQNAVIARNLGINSDRMYCMTYILGSVLAGLAGALYAPTLSIVPTMGSNFMMLSFVTVVVGGADPMTGTLLSGGLLSLFNGGLSMIFGTLMGRLGLLVVAILFIRVLPEGFSGLVERQTLRVNRKKQEAISNGESN